MEEIIQKVKAFAESEKDIIGLALVGSYARGEAREDSDIDFVIITNNPDAYLDSDEWIKLFGRVKEIRYEDYGLAQSKRVFYSGGPEVEFGITTPQWTATNPMDEGTRKVITNGFRILYDRDGFLDNLLIAFQSGI